MPLLTCPHCGLPAMSVWKKLCLGWARDVPCRACGLRVSVSPLPAVAAMLPCLAVVLAITLRWVRDPATMIALGVLTLLATCALHLWAVALVRTQITDAHAVAKARGEPPAG